MALWGQKVSGALEKQAHGVSKWQKGRSEEGVRKKRRRKGIRLLNYVTSWLPL